MIKQFFLAALILLSTVSFGQSQLTKEKLAKDNYKEVVSSIPQSVTPDKFAMYPNGKVGVESFIFKTVVYPMKALKSGIEGEVLVEFTVSTTGDVVNVKVVRGLQEALDKEAVRVIKKLKTWEPAYKDNKPIDVVYQFKCDFKKE